MLPHRAINPAEYAHRDSDLDGHTPWRPHLRVDWWAGVGPFKNGTRTALT